MGNTVGGRRKAKVMKIDGEILKYKTPVKAGDVIKEYPTHVLLESEAVKQYGIRARPLEAQQELKPKKIYFLVELPKFPDHEEKDPRRVRSSIQMSAKDRLECLMLSRRSASDLSIIRPKTTTTTMPPLPPTRRVKMTLPKAQVAKLVEESKDEAEVAEKIMNLYMDDRNSSAEQGPWKPGLGSITESFKGGEKLVGDFSKEGGEIHLASQ